MYFAYDQNYTDEHYKKATNLTWFFFTKPRKILEVIINIQVFSIKQKKHPNGNNHGQYNFSLNTVSNARLQHFFLIFSYYIIVQMVDHKDFR